ncbi:MAG: hypothetical protein J6S21_04520, partial [Victivallales bacterium]|nr:hypothetical protein [Victivallales bacterium]
MMKKFRAAFVNCGGADSINYVYNEGQRSRAAEIADFMPGVYGEADILGGKLAEVEVIFSTWGMPALNGAMMDAMPSLRAVFYAAGATEAFAPACFERGVKVFSAWNANAVPVAEFCLAEILLALKGYYRYVRTLTGPEEFNHGKTGPGIYGETVALIGDGAISRKLQQLLANFNLNILVVPSRKEDRGNLLEEAFRTAQVVSNHLPNRDDDTAVLDGKLFETMRPGAVFINTGRGRQVNEAEMIEVLRKRPDLSALLDVTWPEP